MTDFDYFYGKQPEQYAFYRTPKVLFVDKRFESLTAEAKLLYGILLDRMSLSISNNWTDSEGRNYIYMTIDSIENEMGCARQKACKLLDELEGLGLIERIRQGVGKPNIIYVKNFYTASDMSASSMKIKPDKYENQTSGSMKIKSFEVLKSNGNNTYINNTNNINTNLSIFQDAMDGYREYFTKSLGIISLIDDYPYDEEQIYSILDLIVDTMCSNNEQIKIEGQYKPIGIVKSQLMKLDKSHIEYVLESLSNNPCPVRNVKQYLLTSLYNAPLTMSTYYQAKVNGAFFNDGGIKNDRCKD